MGSIAHSTQRISQLGTTTSTITMARSESVPLDMTMSDVRRILYSQQQVFSLLDRSKEYHLCYGLAALLCNVYRVLEFTSSDIEQENDLDSKNEEKDYYDDDVVDNKNNNNNNNVYQRLREKVSIFRNRDIVTITTQSTDELTDLWYEMDQLMDAVYCLGYEKCYAPPAYHTRDEEEEEEEELSPPPPYVSEKTQLDLDHLFSAIDRLSRVAPRLNNQRVDMTERQANELAAASIGKIVDRLSLGRMNDQRATLPITTTNLKPNKDKMLRDLIIQICHTTSRSLNNQRVSLDSRLQRKMDHVSMHGVLDRLERGRMVDQVKKK